MLHKIRWTSEKIAQRIRLIEPLVYRHQKPLPSFRLLELPNPETEPPVAPDLDDSDWAVVQPNSYWLKTGVDFVLRTHFAIPPEWDKAVPSALFLPLGEAGSFSHPEALAYVDARPYAACNRHHQEIQLAPEWCDGSIHLLALNGWTGTGRDTVASQYIGSCVIVQIDQPTRDFIALARVALGIADSVHEDNPTQPHLYNALDAAFKILDTREPFGERFYASVPLAHNVLRDGVNRAGEPLAVDITAVGHAHIDVAWLWTLSQTRRKVGRTFHNVIRLMEQFPEFHFVQSQPQLYEYARQDYPNLFQTIRKKVAGGQWEPIGGMWVEADCNLSGGESLARQFLLGRRFFREHFGAGAETAVLWLPDVFGYAWNLPQLIKEAGLEYFFTIKIGWSQYNRLPYDSFWWQGLDGTRVLTHFSPTKESGSAFASTYNAKASPSQILSTWTNFQQKDGGQPGVTPPLLMAFGYGDGGGGPTREMLENIREMGSFPAAPRTHCGTVAAFFRQLEAKVGENLPIWNGELYLEYHRGTYTTQARNKRANRKSEFLLHDAEFLAAFASVFSKHDAAASHALAEYQYPHTALNRAWELVCLNQFHDIIPGSSIGPVYEESLQQYAEVKRLGQQVVQEALTWMGTAVNGDVLLVNPTSFTRHDLAFLTAVPDTIGLHKPDGTPVAMQPTADGFWLDAGELPPYSITPLTMTREQITTTSVPVTATTHSLENEFLAVTFNEAGDITRIYDKEYGRDVLPLGSLANQFQLFEDRPKTPDAWEIDIYYDDKMWLADPTSTIELVENGPLRATLLIKRRLFNSEIEQHISLTHNSRRLDFATAVQWQERHILLKIAFPVTVLAPQATYEIQWGNVEHPTHRNTSWDWARFETCAQKWVDLSEGDYGVSLLNDCKYGHDIQDNVMRLTLLRSPTNPDPEADQGEHHFTYSLYPHAETWKESTAAAAYALNDPLIVFTNEISDKPASQPITPTSFITVDQPHVIIETIKQAEDGHDVIVRLYEYKRQRGMITLTVGFPLAQAMRTNLLEENQEELSVSGRQLSVFIKPYQILTLRLVPS
ncbi:MAG: alpha-mannosidase [Chloroflexi bacterium]|nr:alpha-mannosidase [Chloroflexota bacterium]